MRPSKFPSVRLRRTSPPTLVAHGSLLFMLAAALDPSYAQDRAVEGMNGELSIGAAFSAPDDDRSANNGAGLHFSFARPWTEHWYWEASYTHITLETGKDSGTDFYQHSGALDFSYRFGDGQGLTPAVYMGAGLTENDVFPDDLDDVSPFMNVGVGLLSRPYGRSGLRVRGRIALIFDDFESGMTDARVELGVTLPLGRRVVEERIVYRDVVVESPPEIVYREPPDADGDGIPNAADMCPNSLSGAQVDATGCISEPQSITLAGVNFEFGSARLTESAERILVGVHRALRDQPSIQVEIAGHTDSIGSDESNLVLSQARADSVRDYLIGLGLDPGRATARGYGENEPITSEITDEDRATNRRVEFRVLEVRP